MKLVERTKRNCKKALFYWHKSWRSQQNEHVSLNQSLELAHQPKEPDCRVKAISDGGSPGETTSEINIYWEPLDRRGRFRAELADGTGLAMGRQPFLDAARALIAAGYTPDMLSVGWRKGSVNWALRVRLGEAAKLTVNEAGPVRYLEAVSSSAVAAVARSLQAEATSLAKSAIDASTGSPEANRSRRENTACWKQTNSRVKVCQFLPAALRTPGTVLRESRKNLSMNGHGGANAMRDPGELVGKLVRRALALPIVRGFRMAHPILKAERAEL